jgi:bifunctional DNA-binding transcriptional regulator/antitoxin component of YhaV-PrlF toxin-antitoxin module
MKKLFTESITVNAKVSERGQTNIPADLRHRWNLTDGGEIGIIDLGDSALLVPGGIKVAMEQLKSNFNSKMYNEGLSLMEDPDLAN